MYIQKMYVIKSVLITSSTIIYFCTKHEKNDKENENHKCV